MKKFKQIFAVLTGVVCIGSVMALAGCNDEPAEHSHTYAETWMYDETNHWHAATCEHTTEADGKAAHSFNGQTCSVCGYQKIIECNVTFNLNYTGATNDAPTVVNSGEKVTAPQAPGREGYQFLGWYTEAENGTVHNFDSPVTGDLTLYAHWAVEGASIYTVTFDFKGASADLSVPVVEGEKVTAPEDLVKITQSYTNDYGEHKYDFATMDFDGWYKDEDYTELYDFDAAVSGDITLYAKYSNVKYTFEAELTDLTGKTGYGYSISYDDAQLIRYDSEDMNQNASMGYSVGYLYKEELSVEFVIISDRDIDDITLTARLSAEFRDTYIAPEETEIDDITYNGFLFLVNEESLDYIPIALEGAQPTGMVNQRPYDNHVISTTVSLKKGENVIQLYVDNSDQGESTLYAMAPMVDCLYLSGASLDGGISLSWTPIWVNLDDVLHNVV